MNVQKLKNMKKNGEKFTALVLYDACFAKIANEAGIDIIVVGDSVGMVVQGNSTTVSTKMDTMVYHTRSVSTGNSSALLISDLPYMSYATEKLALKNATRLMQAGAQMVKLEGGGKWIDGVIEFLTSRGIPVCAHLGLTPQSFYKIGGHKVQGKENKQAEQILNHAINVQKAGAELLVLECVPKQLASKISNTLEIPVFGAGAGPECDGQVLLICDLLGIGGLKLKFVKDFLEGETNGIQGAIKNFIAAVKNKKFPSNENSF